MTEHGYDGRYRKIALEEHFQPELAPPDDDGRIPEVTDRARQVGVDETYYRRALAQLNDFGAERIAAMDRCGIDHAVISLTGNGVEGIRDSAAAADYARYSNDVLAEAIASGPPGRYSGFAAVNIRDGEQAAAELQRCVEGHGFRGALVNGFADTPDGPLYLDSPRCTAFWEALEALDVPVYLHPRTPAAGTAAYADHPELRGATWGFAPETATHLLRLMTSGLFDRHPTLKLIIGHLGETLSHTLARTEHYFRLSPFGRSMQRSMVDVMADNVWVTTSGCFDDTALIAALLRFGSDRLLFSVDYPYADGDEAADWFERSTVSHSDKRKIARSNAERLFGLRGSGI